MVHEEFSDSQLASLINTILVVESKNRVKTESWWKEAVNNTFVQVKINKLSYPDSCWFVPVGEDETFGESLSFFFPGVILLISSFTLGIKGVFTLQIKNETHEYPKQSTSGSAFLVKLCRMEWRQRKSFHK